MHILSTVTIIIIAGLFLVYLLRNKLAGGHAGAFPLKKNARFIIISDLDRDALKEILTGFYRRYANRMPVSFLRLVDCDGNGCLIHCHPSIDFELFCYLINYLQYPEGRNSGANILAWATAQYGEPWITPEIANKKIMLFNASTEVVPDYIYLTTADGAGYKLRFGPGQDELKLDTPAQVFMPPPEDAAETPAFEDFYLQK